MTVALGRMQVSVRVVEQARPRTVTPTTIAPTGAMGNARHAYESEQRRQEVEADRRRWANHTLFSGPHPR